MNVLGECFLVLQSGPYDTKLFINFTPSFFGYLINPSRARAVDKITN